MSPPVTATATLVSAFVLSRIDYCNSLLFGSTNDVTSHLQRIQNYAARVIFRLPMSSSITIHLKSLHWLPVKKTFKQGMDFSDFRASKDLFDVIIVVDGHENYLHSFPFYVKSEYFRDLAKERESTLLSDKHRVELEDFPGGYEIFSVVADFCYNLKPSFSRHNVIATCCAACMLKMSGVGNLCDVAEQFLQDILALARSNKSVKSLLALLKDCISMTELATACGAFGRVIDVLIKCWLDLDSAHAHNPFLDYQTNGSLTTDFKSIVPVSRISSLRSDINEAWKMLITNETVSVLNQLPCKLFTELLGKSLEQGIPPSVLAEIGLKYVSEAVDGVCTVPSDTIYPEESSKEDSVSKNVMNEANHRPLVPIVPSEHDNCTDPPCTSDLTDNLNEGIEKEVNMSDEANLDIRDDKMSKDGDCSLKCSMMIEELGTLADTVMTALPEDAYRHSSMSLEWLSKVLQLPVCACKRFLLDIAMEKLSTLPSDQLYQVSPSLLYSIIKEEKSDPAKHSESRCCTVLQYLSQRAERGLLDSKTFNLLINVTPESSICCHDSLYGALEFVLKAEESSLSDEIKRDFLSKLNLNLVTESTLQNALALKLFPPEQIADAAVRLCQSLRSELDLYKSIAKMHRKELREHQERECENDQRSRNISTLNFRHEVATDCDDHLPDTHLHSDITDIYQHGKKVDDTISDLTTEHIKAALSVLNKARCKLASYPGKDRPNFSATSARRFPVTPEYTLPECVDVYSWNLSGTTPASNRDTSLSSKYSPSSRRYLGGGNKDVACGSVSSRSTASHFHFDETTKYFASI